MVGTIVGEISGALSPGSSCQLKKRVMSIFSAEGERAFYELAMGVAEGRIDQAAVAVELERIAKSKPPQRGAGKR